MYGEMFIFIAGNHSDNDLSPDNRMMKDKNYTLKSQAEFISP